MNHNQIIKYYTIKRLFCFLDEHMAYAILGFLFHYCFIDPANAKVWMAFLPILCFGLHCIYLSYKNLGEIEKKLGIIQHDW